MKIKGVFTWKVEVEIAAGSTCSDLVINDTLELKFKDRITELAENGELIDSILSESKLERIDKK